MHASTLFQFSQLILPAAFGKDLEILDPRFRAASFCSIFYTFSSSNDFKLVLCYCSYTVQVKSINQTLEHVERTSVDNYVIYLNFFSKYNFIAMTACFIAWSPKVN